MGEDWESEKAKKKEKEEERKKKENSPAPEKFTKSFQDYLNSRLTLEDLMPPRVSTP